MVNSEPVRQITDQVCQIIHINDKFMEAIYNYQKASKDTKLFRIKTQQSTIWCTKHVELL